MSKMRCRAECALCSKSLEIESIGAEGQKDMDTCKEGGLIFYIKPCTCAQNVPIEGEQEDIRKVWFES